MHIVGYLEQELFLFSRSYFGVHSNTDLCQKGSKNVFSDYSALIILMLGVLLFSCLIIQEDYFAYL